MRETHPSIMVLAIIVYWCTTLPDKLSAEDRSLIFDMAFPDRPVDCMDSYIHAISRLHGSIHPCNLLHHEYFLFWYPDRGCGLWPQSLLPTAVGLSITWGDSVLQLISWNYGHNKMSIIRRISKIFKKFLRISVQKWVAYNFNFLHSVTSRWPWP